MRERFVRIIPAARARCFLCDPFFYAHFSNRRAYFLGFLSPSRTIPEERVRGFGLVQISRSQGTS